MIYLLSLCLSFKLLCGCDLCVATAATAAASSSRSAASLADDPGRTVSTLTRGDSVEAVSCCASAAIVKAGRDEGKQWRGRVFEARPL